MTDITEFIDEHDLNAEDVIDALDIDPAQFVDVPDEPHDFYDGEPTVEELADDFDAVDLLVDEKENLEGEVDELEKEVREARRPVYEEKAEELAEMTDKWGDEDLLMNRFDPEDPDEEPWTVDDLAEKIELVEDIKGEETTTVTDESGGGGSETEEPDFDRTSSGKFDLRRRTRIKTE